MSGVPPHIVTDFRYVLLFLLSSIPPRCAASTPCCLPSSFFLIIISCISEASIVPRTRDFQVIHRGTFALPLPFGHAPAQVRSGRNLTGSLFSIVLFVLPSLALPLMIPFNVYHSRSVLPSHLDSEDERGQEKDAATVPTAHTTDTRRLFGFILPLPASGGPACPQSVAAVSSRPPQGSSPTAFSALTSLPPPPSVPPAPATLQPPMAPSPPIALLCHLLQEPVMALCYLTCSERYAPA